jgi:hypothetical protein
MKVWHGISNVAQGYLNPLLASGDAWERAQKIRTLAGMRLSRSQANHFD